VARATIDPSLTAHLRPCKEDRQAGLVVVLRAIALVAVEKLLLPKFAKIKLCQDALQTTFSVFLDISYPPNFRCFEENGLFQHPHSISYNDAMSTLRVPSFGSGIGATQCDITLRRQFRLRTGFASGQRRFLQHPESPELRQPDQQPERHCSLRPSDADAEQLPRQQRSERRLQSAVPNRRPTFNPTGD
jgi:hypothetical protein